MEAPVLWTTEQHALIGAMGLSVYAHVDVQPWPAPVTVPAFENLTAGHASRATSSPAGPSDRTPAAVAYRQESVHTSAGPATVAPALPARRVPTTVPADIPASTAASSRGERGRLLAAMPDRLMLAVLRASGLNPNAPDTQARMATWPLATLRSDPAAKRALWVELRALRKQQRGR